MEARSRSRSPLRHLSEERVDKDGDQEVSTMNESEREQIIEDSNKDDTVNSEAFDMNVKSNMMEQSSSVIEEQLEENSNGNATGSKELDIHITEQLQNSTNADDLNQQTVILEPLKPEDEYINIRNIPIRWTELDVRKLVLDRTQNLPNLSVSKHLKCVNFGKPSSPLAQHKYGTLIFDDRKAALIVNKMLKKVMIEGKALFPRLKMKREEYEKKFANEHVRLPDTCTFYMKKFHYLKVFQDAWEWPEKGTFGLNNDFLNMLDIKLPLTRTVSVTNVADEHAEATSGYYRPWTDVTNFDVGLHKTVNVVDKVIDDRNKLYEVFSLAGKITDVFRVVNQQNDDNPPVRFRITYDHPVEAVQAISMFRGEQLYDQEIVIEMDRMTNPKKMLLPTGLSGVGRGLGGRGFPLSYVSSYVKIHELQNKLFHLNKVVQNAGNQTKNIKTPKSSTPTRNKAPATQTTDFGGFHQDNQMPNLQNVQALLQMMMQQLNAQNTVQADPKTSNMGMGTTWQVQGNETVSPSAPYMWNQGNWQQAPPLNMVNQPSGSGSWQGHQPPQGDMRAPQRSQVNPTFVPPNQTVDHPMQPYGMNQLNEWAAAETQPVWQGSSQSRQSGDSHGPHKNDPRGFYVKDESTDERTDMVSFKYLPPSVGPDELRGQVEKLVGPARLVEVTGRGRALVRFHKPRHADKCIEIFHRSKVDGQIIEVQLFRMQL